ncbi:MAG TPA: amidase [Rhodospirillales bacterium]|jgi:aspartyl-tRNA(Asn)/glutamyl-tRNA(Gln) amidotransferase subunit A|nr:amidase [Rhodospirillales bacterium]HJO68242.1 amidase [Rhodospirillales bacterium]
MAALVPDPMAAGGIAGFAVRIRRGEITIAAAVEAYLERIAALDGRLGAFEHVATAPARAAAGALDALLAAGIDLGPLMGVPVAVKDIIATNGMPTTAGSTVDVADLIGGEGAFVRSLRHAGCVILGKVKTVEFAAGGTGINYVRGTPWNPWDAETQREPSGSSSGSGVAMAAGLCGFAVGSDTTGSVRGPAAHCGVFGLKTTKGLWPTDGVYPLVPTLDTLGPLTRTAADAAAIFSGLTGTPVPVPPPARGLRLGRPSRLFFEGLDAHVERTMTEALARLAAAGAEIVPLELPEAAEVVESFVDFLPIEMIASLGRERFLAHRAEMDPLVAARGDAGLDVSADTYARLLKRHHALCGIAQRRMLGFDGWVAPTRPTVPAPVISRAEAEARPPTPSNLWPNTPAVSYFGLCASSTPIHGLAGGLPVGLQLMCPGGADARLLSIARTFEEIFGPPPKPELAPFL